MIAVTVFAFSGSITGMFNNTCDEHREQRNAIRDGTLPNN